MPPPQVAIIGAGLSGLVLGRCLLHRGITSTIYEKDTARSGLARYGYGITLQPSSYSPLLRYLDIEERTFRRRLAVDAAVGGDGRLNADTEHKVFRANRQRLEALLREGLDIRWEHQLTAIEPADASHTLHFRNGKQEQASCIVDAEGPHSQVRKRISPKTEFSILPYAVYNGKRRISPEAFNASYAPYMNYTNVIEHQDGQTVLQISISDRTKEEVSVSYTYSRPARDNDPIFKPDRPNAGAKDIPEALFAEVESLPNLPGPFRDAFDVAKMRQDRMLHWLMRSVLADESDLAAAAKEGIVLIGDAVHATPILGGNGANAAIRDGVGLAEFITRHGVKDLGTFYEGCHDRCRSEVEESEKRIAAMHQRSRANL